MIYGAVAQIGFTVLAGFLGSRYGAARIAVIGYVIFTVCTFPVFWLVDTKQPGLIVVAMLLIMGPGALAYAVIGAVLDKVFPIHLKYTGLAISGNVSAVIAGFMPALAQMFLGFSHGSSTGPATLALVLGLVSTAGVIGCILIARRDRRRSSTASDRIAPVVHGEARD
jgi:MFS family permease